MKPYIGIIIQARLTSTRFPKKILADFFNKSVLETVVENCHESQLADKVVIAAPHQLGVCLNEELFIGDEHNVLDRYYKCALKYGFDVIVRITSDCPLLPPVEIDRVINRILERDTCYVTNRPAVPDGWDVEAIAFKALKETWELGQPDEHVTTFIKQNTNYNPIFLDAPKLSVDTKEDLERMKEYVIRRKKDTNYWRYGKLCKELPETHTYKS